MRILLGLLLFAGCIVQAQNAISPPATGGGTLTCRQIAEQCDVNCTDPMCLRACGNQGTPDAAALHNAVIDCGMRNSCMDQTCLETQCGAEFNACKGPDPAPANTEPAPPVAE
jgi:hypothetical protein